MHKIPLIMCLSGLCLWPATSALAGKAADQSPSSPVKITWKGAPEISSADGAWSFKPRGRFQVDAVAFNGSDGARDFNSGTAIRRARLGVQGMMPGPFKYQVEFDFSDSDRAKMEDSYIQYQGLKPLLLTVGRHKVYHSLDAATSDLNVPFMERSIMSNAFEAGAGGKLGVSAFVSGSNWTFHIGLMGDDANKTSANDDGWGINSRATYAVINQPRKVLHFGVSAYTRQETEHSVTFADRPEIRVDGTKLLSSGAIPSNNFQLYGAEIATVLGSFSAQAEYERAHVNAIGGPDRNFDGGYVSASYFLTGESRPYKGNKGYFGRVSPKNPLGTRNNDHAGWGALELAVRYSYADLADHGLGNKQHNITTGLNWYPTSYTRFTLNYVYFNTDATGPLAASDDGQAIGVRAQVSW